MQGDGSLKIKIFLIVIKYGVRPSPEQYKGFRRTEILHGKWMHTDRNITRNVGGSEVLNNLMS